MPPLILLTRPETVTCPSVPFLRPRPASPLDEESPDPQTDIWFDEQIRQKASKTLNSLCNEVDSVYLVQNLSHCVKHSGPRSQPMLMEHLNFLVPSVYSRKQQLVNKYVVPVAFSMLNEKSTAVRMTTQKLMMTLHKSMGTQLLQLADQHLGTGMQNRLHDMLASDYM